MLLLPQCVAHFFEEHYDLPVICMDKKGDLYCKMPDGTILLKKQQEKSSIDTDDNVLLGTM